MSAHRLANLAWQMGGDASLIRNLAEDADVLYLVEARSRRNQPIPVAQILGRDWDVRQNLTSGARAGSVVAVNRDSNVKIKRSKLLLASQPGRDVQARYLRVAQLVDGDVPLRMGIVHIPLAKTGRQDDAIRSTQAFVARARRSRQHRPHLRWGVVGDFNMPLEVMRGHLDAPFVSGADVLGVVLSSGWGHVNVAGRRAEATDHHVLTFNTKEHR